MQPVIGNALVKPSASISAAWRTPTAISPAEVEGWRTDRGLVHIIFGTPNSIYKNDDTETWIYRRGEQPDEPHLQLHEA